MEMDRNMLRLCELRVCCNIMRKPTCEIIHVFNCYRKVDDSLVGVSKEDRWASPKLKD